LRPEGRVEVFIGLIVCTVDQYQVLRPQLFENSLSPRPSTFFKFFFKFLAQDMFQNTSDLMGQKKYF
jgi:hypothetical protein